MQNLSASLSDPVPLDDPDLIHDRWRKALLANPHLHGPEAAALLGVPEAALLASATGRGNQPLSGSFADMLTPIADWGRVLLACRNRLGVMLTILGSPRFDHRTPEFLHVRDGPIQSLLSTRGIDRIDLFQERDGHGTTLSLNWFDPDGQVIGRLFLMSKRGRAVATEFLMRFASPDTSRVWRQGVGAGPQMVLWPDRMEFRETPIASGDSAAAWARAVVLGCARSDPIRVDADGFGVASRYAGPLGKVSVTGPAVHATDLLCKLHTRPAKAAQIRSAEHPDGRIALRVIDTDGAGLWVEPAADHERWMGEIERLVCHREGEVSRDSI